VLKAKKNPCCVPGSQSVLFPNTYACAPASGQQFARATNKKHEEIEGMANSMFDLHATFSNRNVTLLAKFDTLNMFHMKHYAIVGRPLMVHVERENALDKIVCKIRDCFLSYPSKFENGTNTHLCFKRRNASELTKAVIPIPQLGNMLRTFMTYSPQRFLKGSKEDTLAFINGQLYSGALGQRTTVDDLLKASKHTNKKFYARLALSRAGHDRYLNSSVSPKIKDLRIVKVLMEKGLVFRETVFTEELLQYETDSSHEGLMRSVAAWNKIFTAWNLFCDNDLLVGILKLGWGKRPPPPPHREVIYNHEKVRMELFSNPDYAIFRWMWRD